MQRRSERVQRGVGAWDIRERVADGGERDVGRWVIYGACLRVSVRKQARPMTCPQIGYARTTHGRAAHMPTTRAQTTPKRSASPAKKRKPTKAPVKKKEPALEF